MSNFKQAFSGLWTSLQQWGINKLSTWVFNLKKAEAIGLCQQYGCKYYVIQQGYWKWQVLRAGAVDQYKRLGFINKNVTAFELAKIAAFIADPKHYK